MTEFNLSEKKFYSQTMLREVYFPEDVKEFIRLDDILLAKLYTKEISWIELVQEKRKLRGDKLK